MKNKALNVVEKILSKHLVEGDPKVDPEIGIRIDQTLTQDATVRSKEFLPRSRGRRACGGAALTNPANGVSPDRTAFTAVTAAKVFYRDSK